MVADAAGCGSLMKKCVQCRSPIEKMVSFIMCCGGQRESTVFMYGRCIVCLQLCIVVCVGVGSNEQRVIFQLL